MNQTPSNDSPVIALLREQFRRTGRPVGILLAVSLVIIGGMILGIRAIGWSDDFAAEPAAFLGVCTYCLVIAILLWGYSDTNNLRAHIPTYALRLPLKTSVLVFWRMMYNLGAVALMCGALAVSVSLASYNPNRGYNAPPEWDAVWVGLLIFLFVQTVCWFVSNYKVLFIAVPIFWVLLFGVWEITEDYLSNMTYFLLPVWLAVALPFAYALSVIGVHSRRHGIAPLSSVLVVSLGNRVRARVAGPTVFESPQQAQCWFESRRLARMLPVTALCLTILGLTASRFIPLAGIYNPGRLSDIAWLAQEFLLFYVAATLIAAVVYGGVSFCKNHRTQTNLNSGFFFNRPMSCKDLAAARILAVGKSLAVAVALVAGATVFLFSVSLIAKPLPWENVLPAIMEAPLMLAGFLVLVWCGMWFGNLLCALFVITSCAYLWVALHDIFRMRSFTAGDENMFMLVGLILWTTTAILLYKAQKQDLFDWRYLRIILCLLALTVIGYGALHSWSFVYVNDELRNALSVLLPLVLAPLATVPLTMQWARHR